MLFSKFFVEVCFEFVDEIEMDNLFLLLFIVIFFIFVLLKFFFEFFLCFEGDLIY